MRGEVYFDGATRPGNPDHSGIGVVVLLEDGERIRVGRYIGIKTNNEAEFMALIIGLNVALDHGVTNVVITGDSKNVIMTVKGEWKSRAENLKILHAEAQKLTKKFLEVEWVHVRGHQGHVENEECDVLAGNAAMYGRSAKRNSNPFSVNALGEVPVKGEIVDPFMANHLVARGFRK